MTERVANDNLDLSLQVGMDRSQTTTTTAAPTTRLAADANVVDTTSDDAGGARESYPPLELGWTRLGKRRDPDSRESSSLPSTKSVRSGNQKNESVAAYDDEDDVDDEDDDFWSWQGSSTCWSCADPNCIARRREVMASSGPGGGGGSAAAKEEVSFLRSRRVVVGTRGSDDPQLLPERLRLVRGTAVWLLPTASPSDLDWFQGYLVFGDAAGRKPWGLLAQQVDIDECLACADGGYRRVSITLFDGTGSSHQNRSSHNLGEADWTGGDMMKLLGSNVRMRPTRLLTGRAAVPYVTGLFGSLWRRVVSEHPSDSFGAEGAQIDSPQKHEVLDLLPDVAIVLGDMELIVPAEPESTDART